MADSKDEVGFSYDKDGFSDKDIPFKIPAKDFFYWVNKVKDLEYLVTTQQHFITRLKGDIKELQDRVFEGETH